METTGTHNTDTDQSAERPQTPSAAQVASGSRWRLPLVGLTAFLLGVGAMALVSQWRNSAKGVVANVNGVPITRQAWEHRMELASGESMLKQMVSEQEQLQFAQKQGILPTDAEVEAKLAELKNQPDFAEKLAASQETPEDVRYSLRVSMIQQQALTRGVTVRDEEIQAFYKLNTDKTNPSARYYQPQTLQLAVIISDQESDIAKAQQELASGKPIAQVVQECSKDQSKNNNGLLKLQRGRMNSKQFPGLEERLFALKPGEGMDKVKINGAWWIIRCLGNTQEKLVPFDQVKEECRSGALLTKGLPANLAPMQSAYADFQKAASVHIAWPQTRPNASQ